MGDINFDPNKLQFFVTIDNKTYYGTPPALCEKLLEQWENDNKKWERYTCWLNKTF